MKNKIIFLLTCILNIGIFLTTFATDKSIDLAGEYEKQKDKDIITINLAKDTIYTMSGASLSCDSRTLVINGNNSTLNLSQTFSFDGCKVKINDLNMVGKNNQNLITSSKSEIHLKNVNAKGFNVFSILNDSDTLKIENFKINDINIFTRNITNKTNLIDIKNSEIKTKTYFLEANHDISKITLDTTTIDGNFIRHYKRNIDDIIINNSTLKNGYIIYGNEYAESSRQTTNIASILIQNSKVIDCTNLFNVENVRYGLINNSDIDCKNIALGYQRNAITTMNLNFQSSTIKSRDAFCNDIGTRNFTFSKSFIDGNHKGFCNASTKSTNSTFVNFTSFNPGEIDSINTMYVDVQVNTNEKSTFENNMFYTSFGTNLVNFAGTSNIKNSNFYNYKTITGSLIENTIWTNFDVNKLISQYAKSKTFESKDIKYSIDVEKLRLDINYQRNVLSDLSRFKPVGFVGGIKDWSQISYYRGYGQSGNKEITLVDVDNTPTQAQIDAAKIKAAEEAKKKAEFEKLTQEKAKLEAEKKELEQKAQEEARKMEEQKVLEQQKLQESLLKRKEQVMLDRKITLLQENLKNENIVSEDIANTIVEVRKAILGKNNISYTAENERKEYATIVELLKSGQKQTVTNYVNNINNIDQSLQNYIDNSTNVAGDLINNDVTSSGDVVIGNENINQKGTGLSATKGNILEAGKDTLLFIMMGFLMILIFEGFIISNIYSKKISILDGTIQTLQMQAELFTKQIEDYKNMLSVKSNSNREIEEKIVSTEEPIL